MVEIIGALAIPVGKLLLKAKLGAEAADIGGSLLQLAFKRLDNRQKAAEAGRKIQAVAEALVADLGRVLALDGVNEGDLAAAVDALGATIEEHVDAKLLIKGRLTPDGIARAVLDARSVDHLFSPGDPAIGYYRRLVFGLSPRLRAVADALPSYTVERDSEFLAKLGELVQTASEMLVSVHEFGERHLAEETRRRRETETHEALYLQSLEEHVRQVTLFGVDIDQQTPRSLPLSIAYIPLRLKLGANDDLKSQLLEYDEVLAILPLMGNRLLIEGAAGSGKTTVLQWTVLEALGVQAHGRSTPPSLSTIEERYPGLIEAIARSHHNPTSDGSDQVTKEGENSQTRGLEKGSDEPVGASDTTYSASRFNAQPWHARIPFLVRLRLCPDGRLPEPEDLPKLIARGSGNAPEPWVRRRLSDGRAIVLLDGIDEVPDGKRRDIKESISNYFRYYRKTQFIVTSRPAAVTGVEWDVLFGPCRAAVQAMAPVDIESFVEQWHRALANAQQAVVDRHAIDHLLDEIFASSSLQQLAATPLLCAAICYLNRVRQGELPRRLNSLYEKLCELLIHRLDRDRFQREGQERLNKGLVDLDLEDKRSLLARLAHFMTREEVAALDIDRATEQVANGLRSIQKNRDAVEVISALQERSGVLRGASPTLIEFAHNGLRSYLAADIFRGERAFGDLISKSFSTDDPDLPVLAAAQGTENFRSQLIKKLTEMVRRISKPNKRRALMIMAQRCGAVGPIPPDVIQLLESSLPHVLPPRTLLEAGQLADLGERIVPALRTSKDDDKETIAACVRCLRLLGGARAIAALDAYLDHRAEEVIEELAQAINPLRIAEIRHDVLGDHDTLHYSARRHIKSIHLQELSSDILHLDLGGTRIDTLNGVERFSKMNSLILESTSVNDLSPVSLLLGLKELILDATGVIDLDPLRHLSQLEILSLDYTSVSTLDALQSLRSLRELRAAETDISTLAPLASLGQLEKLTIDGTKVDNISELNGHPCLQFISLTGSAVKSLDPLRGVNRLTSAFLNDILSHKLDEVICFSNLHTLWLDSGSPIDLSPLVDLKSLAVLGMMDVEIVNYDILGKLAGLRELWLDGSGLTSLEPMERLAHLQKLSVARANIQDLSPLSGLHMMQELYIDGCPVKSLAPLRNLKQLTTVSLIHTPMNDISALLEIEKLESVTLPTSFDRNARATADELAARGVKVGYIPNYDY